MNHYKNNLLEELHRLTEAVQASHADIAPTYLEYTQLAFAIATDCGEAGRADFMSCAASRPSMTVWRRRNCSATPCTPARATSTWEACSTWRKCAE